MARLTHWRGEMQYLAPANNFTNTQASRSMPYIFCENNLAILAQTDLSYAIYDSFPASKGHSLVIPKRHLVSIWDMTSDEYADAFNLVRTVKNNLVRTVKNLLQEKFEPQGFNIGANCGEAAGQSIFHAHIHIIPRFAGDVPNPRGGIRHIIPGKGNY